MPSHWTARHFSRRGYVRRLAAERCSTLSVARNCRKVWEDWLSGAVAGGGHPGVEGGAGKKVVSPQLRREAVLVMQVEVELSQRRACGLMELCRGTCRYRRRRAEDGRLRTRLRELAEERRRFGYRRLQVLLEREGWQVNHML